MHFCSRAIIAAAIAALFCSIPGPAQTGPADRLLSPIVASQRTLINPVHPLATKQNDLGRVNGSQVFHRMILLLHRSDAQEADLRQLLKDQQDPKSPLYHQWLTPAQFGQRFGPSDNDLQKIAGWLQSQGFSVEKPSNGRQFLLFTGASAQVESAFQTEMHSYAAGGRTFLANARPASIPSALAPAVSGVASLNSVGNFKPQSYAAVKPQLVIGQDIFTGPADLAAIYNAAPLQTANVKGQGQSIALLEESNIDLQDLTDFRTVTGLPAATVNVIVNGPDPGPLAFDFEEFEAIADVEYAGAMAPAAALNVIVSASTEFNQGIDLSTAYAVDNLVSPITSLSYGGCETVGDTFTGSVAQFYSYAWEQGAAEGISHFVSSGDNGGDACAGFGISGGYGVNELGDSPWNVSVGGTEFVMPDPYVYFPSPNYTATGYVPESTWNDYENPYDGRALAGNGGVSINWSKPAWQAGTGIPADGMRDVPDVSLLSGDNLAYLTCERDIGYDCSKGIGGGVIGTSLAAPNWAAIQALVNQKNNLINGAGNPNPVFYGLAAGSNSPFHDITAGDTKVPDLNGQLVGYAATTGYDLATGLGSVDINKLATAWAPATGSGAATVDLTTSGATTITHGDLFVATASVTGGGATPTGDLALMAGTQGVIQLSLLAGHASFDFGNGSGSGLVELPGGTYNLTAHYAGDGNYAPATSNAVALTVNPEPTTTTSQITFGPVYYGTPVQVAAEAIGVNSGSSYPVPGAYTFSESGTTLGTASIAQTGERFSYLGPNTMAVLTLSGAHTLAAGNHSISVASPPASASYLASSTASPVSITVVQGAVVVSLTPDHTTPAVNSTVNLLAGVLNGYGTNVPVTGSVEFLDATTNTNLGTVKLPSTPDSTGTFNVTLPTTFATAGLHTLVALYSGDDNDSSNVSGAVNITVGGKASTVTTAMGQSFGFAGNALSFSAKVAGDSAGAAPTGSVTFTDASANNATVGTAPVATTGAATVSLSTLSAGWHYIVANYQGDANYSGSVSASVPVLVGDFTFASSPSSASAAAGQSTSAITLTYTGSADFTSELVLAPSGTSVLLSCSGLPTGAACSFSQAAITPTVGSNGKTSGTGTVIFTTTGPTLAKASNDAPRTPWSAGGIALAGLLALGLPLAFRRRRYFQTLLGLVLLAAVASLGACSGGGGGSTGYTIVNPGTPAGTSTVTVTATINGGPFYGTLSHTATVSLTVTAQGN